MEEELLQPGISVVQQFRTVTPTVVTPLLVPCVVGPAFQIVEAYETDRTGSRSVNSDASISLPPTITSNIAGPYTGLDGLELKVSVNDGAPQTITFSDPTSVGLSAAQVRSQILATSGVSGWAPYVVTMGSSSYIQLKGNVSGDNQTLKVLDGDANTNLGLNDFFTSYGFSSYKQDKLFITQKSFPNPNNNIDELDFDEDSIRVFINTGSTLMEVKRDQSFLRNGKTAWVQSSAITFPTSSLKNKDLQVTFSYGAVPQVITFDGNYYSHSGTLVVPNSEYYASPGTDAISIQKNDDTPVDVTFSSPVDIDAAVTEINNAWDAEYSGEDVAYRATANGTPNVAGTYIAFQVGGSTATGDIVKVIEKNTGNAFSDIGFTSASGAMGSSLVYFINTTMNSPAALPAAVAVTDGGSKYIKLLSYTGYLLVDKDGVANSTLGFSAVADSEQYAIECVDDGDGDTKSPIFKIHNEDFTLDAAGASLTGTADLSGEIYLHKKTFQLSLDGNPMQEIEFNGGIIVTDQAAGAFPGTWNSKILNMKVNGSDKQVTFSNPSSLSDAVNQINAAAGQPVVYRSTNLGVYSALGTYLSFRVGGTADAGGEIELVYSGSTAWANIGFTSSANEKQVLTAAEIETMIEDTMGAGCASIVGNKLVLTSADFGEESKIKIGQGTANSVLGFTSGDVVNGLPFKPKAGDYLYVDGQFTGIIIQVSPGAVKTNLRLDREYIYSSTRGKNWYIVAMSIPDSLPSDRPTPNLVVDLAGNVSVKHDLLRNTMGEPLNSAMDQIILTYKALRLDVSSSAENAELLTFEDTTALETALSPINPDNPLSLGLFLALLNAPGTVVKGIGVDAVSADAPYGTELAYSKACTFLESKEVYGIVPLTHDKTVHQVMSTHVDSMSEPDARGERIVFINPEMPTRNLDALVGSGTDGDSTGVTNEFDTKLTSIASSLLSMGIDPSQPISVDDGVFLDISSDSNLYNISSVSGTKVTINVTFAPGENDDGFYSSSNLPSDLISESFSIKIRGSELVDINGDPDYDSIASAYSALAKSYANRRVFLTAPDKISVTINGLEQVVEGFYCDAATVGIIGQQRPQQGHTNFPITGPKRVIGSTDVFSNRQMSKAAAGGVFWYIQESANSPLTCRHQLSTNVSSIETRELSITKCVDFCSKFMRSGIRNFIGKFNITQPFLDSLTTVVQGQISFLSENGIIIGGDINNILQDTTNPDTLLIDVTLQVPYPCNYIRLTLIV